MHRSVILLAGFMALFCAFLDAQVQPNAPTDRCSRHISVAGTAEVLVDPDTATIRIGVDSRNAAARQAVAVNHEAVSRVVAIAKEMGVVADDIQNDYVSLRRVTEQTKGVKRVGFEASETLSIKLHTLERYSELMRALVEAGGNRIDSVDFTSSKVSAQRDTARRMAFQAAKRKAELLAKEASVTLGEVCTVQESAGEYGWTGGSPVVNVVTKSGSSEDYNTSGKIAVSATVSVMFAIQ